MNNQMQKIGYIKFLFIVFLFCIFLFPLNSYAQCNKDGTTVVYVNGIFTPTRDLAEADKDLLRDKYKEKFDISNITFRTGYNPSHLAGLGDLVESASQIFNSPISDFDFKTILAQIHSEIKTQKIILVGYSQGSLYTNELYKYLINNGAPKESIAVYNVATPANYVAGNGGYITSKSDGAINQIRELAKKVNAPQPLPGTINLSLSQEELKNSSEGHSFSKAYLEKAPKSMTSSIKEKIENLVSTETALPKQGCFNLPEQSWTFKTQGVVFSIADPVSNGTVYVAKVGYEGTVVAAKTTANSAIGLASSMIDAVILTGKIALDTSVAMANVMDKTIVVTEKVAIVTAKVTADTTVAIAQKIIKQTPKLTNNEIKKEENFIKNKTELAVADSNKIISNSAKKKEQPKEIVKKQEILKSKNLESSAKIKTLESKVLGSKIIAPIINPLPALASDLSILKPNSNSLTILKPVAQNRSQHVSNPYLTSIFIDTETSTLTSLASTSTATLISTSTATSTLTTTSTSTDLLNKERVHDFQEPETILDKFPDATTSSTTAFFSFSSNEQNVVFQYSLDDQEWKNGTSTKEYSDLKLGKHILKIRAVDEFNNIDTSPIIFQWQIIKKVLPLSITKIQIASAKNDNDEYIELYNPNDEVIDLSDYSIQKKSGDLTSEKKLSGNIPANRHFLIANANANEAFCYLADLKYDNFVLNENDTIYLIRNRKETEDDLDDFDVIDAEENLKITDNLNPINSRNENGPTYLSGKLKEDMILLAKNNPYIIEDHLTVPKDKILTINPGVIIFVISEYYTDTNLTTYGVFIVNGTKENPVKFVSLITNPQTEYYEQMVLQAALINEMNKNTVFKDIILEFENGNTVMAFIAPMIFIDGNITEISEELMLKYPTLYGK